MAIACFGDGFRSDGAAIIAEATFRATILRDATQVVAALQTIEIFVDHHGPLYNGAVRGVPIARAIRRRQHEPLYGQAPQAASRAAKSNGPT